MAKWRKVEGNRAVNFDQVTTIYVSRDSYFIDGGSDDRVDLNPKPWYVAADKAIVQSGFETEADAVKALTDLIDELEPSVAITLVADPTGLPTIRRAFPGVDNAGV